MTKSWILFCSVVLTMASCGDNTSVGEKEKPLLGDTTQQEEVVEAPKAMQEEIHAVSLKESHLLEKPEVWSKSNPSVEEGKFYFGSKALILAVNEEGKRRYLKLRLNDGTEGWSQDWLIVENAERAVVTSKSIRLYKKADIAAFSDKKVVLGQKVAVGNEVVGGFQKLVYKGEDEKPYTFWVKEREVRHLSKEDNDYLLADYFEKLKVVENEDDKLELIEDVKDNEDFKTSVFYRLILDLSGEEEQEDFEEETDLDSLYTEDEIEEIEGDL